ncbi:hypothetical protein O181_038768 [Austropuccinia psidii MF-1]|uniref:Uncharacterized protein n=1 Tax=Austropuccinia psidii MF-1 TaxID=1389203 RepID=A0A9Q3DC21_9BASI|nr:hypothetical protein [Austropuccinia psidii MF-1]
MDGEEVEVVLNSIGHQSSTSIFQPAAKIFQSQVIPSTPEISNQSFPLFHPPLPSPSTSRPSLALTVRPSPIPQPRNSPMVTSQKLQPVASSSKRREDLFPFVFPSAQVFNKKENCPIWVTREDPNMENKGQDSVAILVRIVDRNSREVITHANGRIIPGNAYEDMAAKFAFYED